MGSEGIRDGEGGKDGERGRGKIGEGSDGPGDGRNSSFGSEGQEASLRAEEAVRS